MYHVARGILLQARSCQAWRTPSRRSMPPVSMASATGASLGHGIKVGFVSRAYWERGIYSAPPTRRLCYPGGMNPALPVCFRAPKAGLIPCHSGLTLDEAAPPGDWCKPDGVPDWGKPVIVPANDSRSLRIPA